MLVFQCVLLLQIFWTPLFSYVHILEPSRVEVGSNTSTVALRVVGGDEKGSLESETVKYGHESHGTSTQK
jgi:hypothetical protein